MDFFAKANQILSEQESAFAFYRSDGNCAISTEISTQDRSIEIITNSFYLNDPMPDPWSTLNQLHFLGVAIPSCPPCKTVQQLPKFPAAWKENKAEWMSYCHKIESALSEGKIKKIVAARNISTPINESVSTQLRNKIFSRLCFYSPPNSYCFAVKKGGHFFLGASPELLFQKKGSHLFVPAIAGTISYTNEEERAQKEKLLLESAKDRHEHQLVIEGIVESLQLLGIQQIQVSPITIKSAGNLLHLYTGIHAECPEKVRGHQLVQALHPTPAIGGSPKKDSLDFLHENEPWNRGLFSSPILVSFPGEEICIVAIRSALFTAESLYLFAGAGYVKGSSAEEEWKETDKKMNTMRRVIWGDGNE